MHFEDQTSVLSVVQGFRKVAQLDANAHSE